MCPVRITIENQDLGQISEHVPESKSQDIPIILGASESHLQHESTGKTTSKTLTVVSELFLEDSREYIFKVIN